MSATDEDSPNDWVLAVCSIIFDIDVGQKLEASFPQNALSSDEENDIAFHSFPVRPTPLPIQLSLLSCQHSECPFALRYTYDASGDHARSLCEDRAWPLALRLCRRCRLPCMQPARHKDTGPLSSFIISI